MTLKGKVLLITGAGRRIGKEIALSTAQLGALVVVHYFKSCQDAESIVEEITRKGGKALAVQGDIRNIPDCERIVAETIDRFKTIDILVNNASQFFKTPFITVTGNEWDDLIDTNLKGSFFCAQAAAKWMMKKGGKIINIADWSAIRPYIDYLPYCISKAGVIALTKGLAKTLAPNITVNAIAPGPILPPEDFDGIEKGDIIRNTPLNRFGSPQDIVNTILYLIEGSDFMTGTTITIDGGRLIA